MDACGAGCVCGAGGLCVVLGVCKAGCVCGAGCNNDSHIKRRNLISSLCCKLSPMCVLKWSGRSHVKITCNTSSAYLLQPAVCDLVQRDSSATNFDGVEIAFVLVLFYWLK